MKTIEIPELKDCMTDNIETKILSMPEEGLIFWNFLKHAVNWKNEYTIVHQKIENKDIFRIEQIKGIQFSSKEEAETYSFLDYCIERGFKFFNRTKTFVRK